MKFGEHFASALTLLKQDAQDRQAVSEISSSFWSWFTGTLGDIIHKNGDTNVFIDENADLLDFGIEPAIIDAAEVKETIVDCDIADCRVEVRTITSWLRDLLLRVKAGDKMEKLERDLKLEELKHGKATREVQSLQAERRERIETMYYRPTDPAKQLAALEAAEEILLDNIRTKKEISKGIFMAAEDKRKHVQQQMDLQKRLQFCEAFIATLPGKDAIPEMKEITKTIEKLFVELVDIETVKKKIMDELENLQKKTAEMSTGEIEARLTDEIEYIRDLVRLSAKRLSLDPFPLIRPEDKLFSLSTLSKNLSQITEFDPYIFKNDRVPLFGRPYVLLVPGTGNAIYDWKNNCIIMPTIAPGGNFMGSLATGIIEYRLDVDETKTLLTSFNQLPDLKAVRSIIALKARLIKEYITWMTSEYNGFRILSKDSKKWFEQEIGPSRNDIYTPLELQGYTLTTSEFNSLLDEATARIDKAENSGKEASPEDLWVSGLLQYQIGKPEKALPLLEKYAKMKPDDLKGLYNLGFIAMKQMNRTLAREAFGAYCKLDTQSWWSKLVREHLRNLGPA